MTENVSIRAFTETQLTRSLESKYPLATWNWVIILIPCQRFWTAYGRTFDRISEEADDVRAVILSSSFPKLFTAGLDRMWLCLSAERPL